MLFTSLYLPMHMREGIKMNHRGSSKRKFIYGGDTETCKGPPMTFQFYSERPNVDDIIFVDPQQAARTFLRWCKKREAQATHVIYVHNLNFDLQSLLWEYKQKLVETSSGEFDFAIEGWRVQGVYDSPTFARFTDGTRTVVVVDSFSYYRASLAAAAEVFCPDLPKLAAPAGLGSKLFTKRDTAFCEYAMRDAVVAYHIGVALEALHIEFDLAQTVSVADMASRIFRHKFLERPIPQPSRTVIEASLHAYHGGKNNTTAPPGWHLGVSSLDISSAYPHAMASFPSFSEARLYRTFTGTRVREVPELGVYRIRGRVDACAWPSLFAHDFSPLEGKVEGVYVSGYELNEALRSHEFHPSRVSGWFYEREKDKHAPPLRAFVNDFYARKEAEKKDKAKRAMYKFILNSISGKFIQTRKHEKALNLNIDSGKIADRFELVAGGMFHSFIAQAITGHTRARIHQLEHRYEALHTATDGIFTQRYARNEGEGLGALVCEAKGDLLLLRNKLYVLYGPPTDKTRASHIFKGKHIIKVAMHGFQGTVQQLEALIVSGRRRYAAERVNRLRDSLKRGKVPNRFERRDYVLKVGALPVHKRRKR